MKKITLTKTFKSFSTRLMFCFFLLVGLSDVVFGQVSYTQDFSATTHGWSTGFTRSTTNTCATTASLRKNLYSSAPTGVTGSPTVGASNGGLITMTYYYKVIDYSTPFPATPNTFGSFKVQFSTDNTTWYDASNSTVGSDHLPATDCVQKTVTFTPPPSTALYVRFNATWATGDYYLHFDDVAISQGAAPSCLAPTGLTSSAITSSSATVTWTASTSTPADGYEFYYSSSSALTETTVPSGSTAAGVVTTNLTGLTDNTQYYVWVRSKCSTTDISAWTPASTFRTLCLPFGNFSENFDGLTGTGLIPSCWSKILSGTGLSTTATVGTSTTNNSAPNSLSLYNSASPATANLMLVTPVMNNLSAGTNRLRFFARNSTATEDLQIGTMSNPADASTFTVLTTIDLSTTWTEYAYSFAAYTGTDTYIAFRRLSTSTYTYVYLDNVVWEAIPTSAPTCVTITSPVNLAVNVPNPTITWNPSVDATSYKISIGTTAGGTDILNQFSVGNVVSYYLAQAESGTTYFVTVYPVNQYGTSTGCTEISFTTCDENITLSENFDTAASGSTVPLPTCWDRLGTTGSSYVTTGSVAPATPANRWYLYASATTVAYAHTPILSNLAANTHRLRFKAYSATANKNLSIGYLTTPGNVATFTLIQDINLGTATAAASILEYVVVPGALPAGVTKLVFRNSSQNATIYFDDVLWEEQPAVAPNCAANVVATPNATCGNFATAITWDAVSGINGYKLSIGTSAGGTQVLNNQVTAATSYSHLGNPGTTYYFKVVPFNGVGDATGCTEITYSTNATGCFCASNPTSNDNSGITNVKIVTTDFPTTDVTYFDHTATAVNVQQGVNTNVQISFATGYTYGTNVWIDLNNNFTFETSELLYSGESLATNPTILNASFMMPATAELGQHRMRIATADSGQVPANPCYSGAYGVTLDFTVNVAVAPACLPPSALTSVSVSPTAQNIGWTENGTATTWDIEWGTNGFTPTGTPTIAATTTNPYALTGLTPNTTYKFYVRAVCGASTLSDWTGPFTFTTACATFGNFSENFDGLTVSGSIPNCWSRILSGAGLSTFASVGISTTNNSAPNAISFYNSNSTATDNMMLVSPVMNNLSAGTNRLRFFAINSTASEDIQVGTMSNPADASTFTVLTTVDLSTTWAEYSVSFAGYTGTNTHLAFRRLSTSTYTYVYLDNVVWEAIPTTPPACVTITSPVDLAENVLSGTITWSPSADATSYKITVGTTATGTNILNAVDLGNVTSYNLVTEPGTTYFVTIFPVNQYGTSTGCTTISFTTCDSLNAPVLVTFDTFLPGCWSNRFGGDLLTGPAATGFSGWSGDGFANNGTTGAIRNNIYTTGANDWVISPVVSIPATGYELKFDAAAVQYNATGAPTTPWEADDFIQVLVSTNGISWTALYTFNNTNQPSITGTTTTIDLDAYASQDVRFAFRAVEGATADGSDIDFSIDNFEVRLTPAVAPGCSTITATTNANCGNFATAISWTAAIGANGYKLSIGTSAGGTQILNASDVGTALTYSYIGSIGTTYYVTVTPYNVVGNATGCTSISFTTNSAGCYCTSAPTSVDGTGITNVQLGTTNFPNTVATGPVYSDNTVTAVDMTQGISNNVQLTFDVLSFGTTSYDYNTVIWIDANDNYTFEASEIVYTGVSPTTAAPTSLNASFVVPTTVTAGNHRMRIVATDDEQIPANSCYSGAWGETVDFKVNVIVLKNDTFDDASFVYYPNPVTDVLTISYANEISKVQVMNLLGQEVMVKSINATQSQIDMSNLATGSYLVKVTSDNKVKTIKVIKR